MTAGKRLFDLLLALILSVLLSPPILGIALWLLLSQGRPVFYVADRMKTPTQRFGLWKFRTMTTAPGERGVSGGHKAARVTPAGQVLRATRLDELPQLWNILRGDLSFVGPRPPLPEYVARFPDLYAQVLRSRPGVTGLATLIYHRHEDRLLAACATPEETDTVYARVCVPRKARIDLIYQANRSLRLDIWILLRTLGAVLRRNGG